MTQRSLMLLTSLLTPVLLLGCPPPSPAGPGGSSGTVATAPATGETPAPAPQPTAAPTPAPTATPAPAPSSAGSDAARARWVGNWSSASCGERKYERVVNLGEKSSFSARELVSPCPPNARCVWSGIINYSGTWEVKGEGVTLTTTKQDNGPGKVTLASALNWSADANAPAEPADASCVYQKK